MAGIDTLAIDVSRMFMKVASESAMLPSASAPSVSGDGAAGAGGFEAMDARRQNALLITPPSTRSAAPVVAEASGLAT